MKKILNIFSVAAILLFAVSCKKSDNSNPLTDIANFGKGAYITLNSNINLNLNYAQVATSKVGVKVSVCETNLAEAGLKNPVKNKAKNNKHKVI